MPAAGSQDQLSEGMEQEHPGGLDKRMSQVTVRETLPTRVYTQGRVSLVIY
jgi:hypothetical protein